MVSAGSGSHELESNVFFFAILIGSTVAHQFFNHVNGSAFPFNLD